MLATAKRRAFRRFVGLSILACIVLLSISCLLGTKEERREAYTLVLAPAESTLQGFSLTLFSSSTGSIVPVISAHRQDTFEAASSPNYERMQEGLSYGLALSKSAASPRPYMTLRGWPGTTYEIGYMIPHTSDTAFLELFRNDSLLVTLYESSDIVGPFIRKK